MNKNTVATSQSADQETHSVGVTNVNPDRLADLLHLVRNDHKGWVLSMSGKLLSQNQRTIEACVHWPQL